MNQQACSGSLTLDVPAVADVSLHVKDVYDALETTMVALLLLKLVHFLQPSE